MIMCCVLFCSALARGQQATSSSGTQTAISVRSLASYPSAKKSLELPACRAFFDRIETRPGHLEDMQTIRVTGHVENTPGGHPALAVTAHPFVYLFDGFFQIFESTGHPSQAWFLDGMRRWLSLSKPLSPVEFGGVALLHEYSHFRGGVDDDGDCIATNLLVTYSVLVHCYREYAPIEQAGVIESRILSLCKCGDAKKLHCSRAASKLLCTRTDHWHNKAVNSKATAHH